MDFGFTINAPRAIYLDKIDPTLRDRIIARERTTLLCIGCGSCTATCTTGQFTSFSLRKMQHLIRRGEYDTVRKSLQECMLCGKCRMVCPRGVHTRAVIHAMLEVL
ncbi:4Fe-4S dicluster domain-containing protein [Millionella massiliensis]|uniref:4Fe-4S dicluster domain-containing protein n=1 Tax=Millionella massiliensis TaxID=1871023 RepID=UPI0023A81BBA|nr:4Fe-4S dicluster domain-containing protein [Millionella massiliensis]